MREDIIDIFNICSNTREAIIANKSRSRLFKDFPYGCCRDASLLMAHILNEHGYNNITYCAKDIDDYFCSHAWLQYDDYIIDITSDQFGADFPPVIVVPIVSGIQIHILDRSEPATLGIVGMDIFDLQDDLKRIKEYLSRYDVQPFLKKEMPGLITLLGEQNIAWTTINQLFRNHIVKIKNGLTVDNETNSAEATFFTILHRRMQMKGDTDAMFYFFEYLFDSLNTILKEEKGKLNRIISDVLLSTDRKYLNFIGELATLNHYLLSGNYRLEECEAKIGNKNNASADFRLLDRKINASVFIEVLNIHCETHDFDSLEHLEMFLKGKLIAKVRAKFDIPGKDMFVQPVIWIKSLAQLEMIIELYKEFEIENVVTPLCYVTFVDKNGSIEYAFNFVDKILKY